MPLLRDSIGALLGTTAHDKETLTTIENRQIRNEQENLFIVILA